MREHCKHTQPAGRFAYSNNCLKLLAVCFGSIATGAIAPAIALAEAPLSYRASSLQSPSAQASFTQPSSKLQSLLNSIPQRPLNPLPVLDSAVVSDIEMAANGGREAPVMLRLRLSDRRVYVFQGETVIKSYPVAIGRKGWETPIGEFSVKAQVRDPGWTNPLTNEVMGPGPDNPLGDRWIAFWTDGTNVIGFHGTPNRDSIGKAASHGCVRMYNEDVRELFELVSIGTPVIVEP